MKKILIGLVMLAMLASFQVSTVFALDDNVCIADRVGTDKGLIVAEAIPYYPSWEIHKFKDPDGSMGEALKKGAPVSQFKNAEYEMVVFKGNIALREGISELLALAAAIGTPTAWSNAAAYLGVGDTATAEAATQTGLVAPTNKFYADMDATYPQIVTVGTGSNNALEWRTTFASGEANFAWEEYSVSNTNADTGKNLNRKISSKGTKVSGETWTLSLKVCFGTECS
jgi:hypothetical protein